MCWRWVGTLLIIFQERQKVANSFKARGNSAYQAREFAKAAELYTRAIEISPKSEPVYYSNRAACAS